MKIELTLVYWLCDTQTFLHASEIFSSSFGSKGFDNPNFFSCGLLQTEFLFWKQLVNAFAPRYKLASKKPYSNLLRQKLKD